MDSGTSDPQGPPPADAVCSLRLGVFSLSCIEPERRYDLDPVFMKRIMSTFLVLGRLSTDAPTGLPFAAATRDLFAAKHRPLVDQSGIDKNASVTHTSFSPRLTRFGGPDAELWPDPVADEFRKRPRRSPGCFARRLLAEALGWFGAVFCNTLPVADSTVGTPRMPALPLVAPMARLRFRFRLLGSGFHPEAATAGDIADLDV